MLSPLLPVPNLIAPQKEDKGTSSNSTLTHKKPKNNLVKEPNLDFKNDSEFESQTLGSKDSKSVEHYNLKTNTSPNNDTETVNENAKKAFKTAGEALVIANGAMEEARGFLKKSCEALIKANDMKISLNKINFDAIEACRVACETAYRAVDKNPAKNSMIAENAFRAEQNAWNNVTNASAEQTYQHALKAAEHEAEQAKQAYQHALVANIQANNAATRALEIHKNALLVCKSKLKTQPSSAGKLSTTINELEG